MVFHPYFPLKDLCELIVGVLMITAASYAINVVKDGSKNKFAFALLSFTILLGTSYVG
jgi:hypothetical protein